MIGAPVSSAPTRRVPYAEAARELLRGSLLDVAVDLLADRPWTDVTMAAIASGAGVSRQTLYNEFGSRHEFAQALVLREVDRFLAAVEAEVLARLDDPRGAIAAAFSTFLGAAASNPLVRALVSGDGTGDLLPLVTVEGAPVVQRASERIAKVLQQGWPTLDIRKIGLLAESVVRLGISFAALPHSPSAMTPDAVAELLGPFVEEAVAAARSRTSAPLTPPS